MGEIEIREVASKGDMKTFIRCQSEIMKDVPHFAPPLGFERAQFFSEKKNPWFKHGRAAFYIAMKDGECAGRITAQIDDFQEPVDGQPVGFFGNLVAIEDQAVVDALIAAAKGWLAGQGYTVMRGPYSMNTNAESGLQIDGFDSHNYILMPQDPPWLPPMVEAAGLKGAKDLVTYRLDCTKPLPDRPRRLFRNAPEGMIARPGKLKEWASEVGHMIRLFNLAWGQNWGYLQYSDDEVRQITSELRPLVDVELCRFVELDGEVVGFITMLPNIYEPMEAIKGRLFPFGIFRLLWWLLGKKAKTARVLLMGVDPKIGDSIAGRIAPLLLIYSPEDRVHARGIEELEFGWILEDNAPVRSMIEMIGGTLAKTYRIYEAPTS
ncbi:MAG: dATP pyrophosphohydrolase [Pseudomonadota bacterium]